MLSPEVQHLTDEVTQANTVMASAGVLIGGLAARLRDVAEDSNAVKALADELDTNSNALASAVAANAPAAPLETPTDPAAG